MTKTQREDIACGRAPFCHSLFVSGFTFPDINGTYVIKTYRQGAAFYQGENGYALVLEGDTYQTFYYAKIVTLHGGLDDIIAYKDSINNMWVDYFGDCHPTITKV